MRCSPETERRREVMRLCADARAGELDGVLAAIGFADEASDVRAPESGLVMLRARMGGDGAPFNLGEATVTRATVALGSGTLGFAYHLGRDRTKARSAAILDALWQEPARRDDVEAALDLVRSRLEDGRAAETRRVAATRVDFFTLVRGDD